MTKNINEKYAASFSRNVIDSLKEKSVEEIKTHCRANMVPAAIAMFNVDYDFNISSLVRTCNFMGFEKVFHIQKEGRRFDRRGCVGTHNYTEIAHCYDEEEFFKTIKYDYIPVAVENNIDFPSKNAYKFQYPVSPCFIFGAENKGLNDSVLLKCAEIITIPNFGSVRSLNVACTASVIMSLYSAQYRVEN